MFVQTLEGDVVEAGQFMAQIDRWQSDLMPDATGFLGATAGVSDSGTAFLAARFETEAAARSNQGQPAAEAWWADTVSCFTDSPRLAETSAVGETLGGTLDDAQLLVVVHAAVTDPVRHEELRERIVCRREENISAMFLDHPSRRVTILSYLRAEEDTTALSPALAALSLEVASTISGSSGLRVSSPRLFTP